MSIFFVYLFHFLVFSIKVIIFLKMTTIHIVIIIHKNYQSYLFNVKKYVGHSNFNVSLNDVYNI